SSTGFQGRSPRHPISREESLQQAAARGGTKTGSFATCPLKYRRFFEVMAQELADSLFAGVDVESWVYRRLIVELAERHRLPAIYPRREYVEAGGLLAYALEDVELWT